jgi:hypothetical protein
MSAIQRGRQLAEIDGDFVVVLHGARISLLHPLRSWVDLGSRRGGMKAMLDHLLAHPEKGLLGYTMGFPVMVQYWRSFEHLQAFAHSHEAIHRDTVRRYYARRLRRTGGVGTSGFRPADTGIWHETFLVRSGEYEAIYTDMPVFGLGKAGRLKPAHVSSTARRRLHRAP